LARLHSHGYGLCSSTHCRGRRRPLLNTLPTLYASRRLQKSTPLTHTVHSGRRGIKNFLGGYIATAFALRSTTTTTTTTQHCAQHRRPATGYRPPPGIRAVLLSCGIRVGAIGGSHTSTKAIDGRGYIATAFALYALQLQLQQQHCPHNRRQATAWYSICPGIRGLQVGATPPFCSTHCSCRAFPRHSSQRGVARLDAA